MAAAYPSETKAEAIRLRVEEELSLSQVAKRLGVSKSTASLWLKPFPLPEGTVSRRIREHGLGHGRKPYNPGPKSRAYLAVEGHSLSKQRKAKIAEAAVLFRLTLHGLPAYGSWFDGDKADWLVRVPSTGRRLTLQVKWARQGKTGAPSVRLKCSEGRGKLRRYVEGEFDFIVGYDLWSDTCYVWSWDEVAKHTSTVSICPEAAERWDKLF